MRSPEPEEPGLYRSSSLTDIAAEKLRLSRDEANNWFNNASSLVNSNYTSSNNSFTTQTAMSRNNARSTPALLKRPQQPSLRSTKSLSHLDDVFRLVRKPEYSRVRSQTKQHDSELEIPSNIHALIREIEHRDNIITNALIQKKQLLEGYQSLHLRYKQEADSLANEGPFPSLPRRGPHFEIAQRARHGLMTSEQVSCCFMQSNNYLFGKIIYDMHYYQNRVFAAHRFDSPIPLTATASGLRRSCGRTERIAPHAATHQPAARHAGSSQFTAHKTSRIYPRFVL